jgi:hypothetical protein
MLKKRREAAEQVAAQLFSAEAAVSAAIAEVAELVKAAEAARAHANLSHVVASAGAGRAIKCLAALGEAKAELVQAHHDYAEAQADIGLRAVALGAGGGQKSSDFNLVAVGSEQIAA